ncbi:hypothetical protein DPMN_128598 [Dreissena polymorpha]|uniref:Uncharacterized protein n=1 Tax=Dreissena polymorpha TaxID=45954 RepID=A0A9D4H161_DREPO|nr:hypothetical protein DPMN_128598 [Dreissena polymorpha]
MVHNGSSVIAKDPLLPKTAPLLPLQSLGRSDFSQKLESSLSPASNTRFPACSTSTVPSLQCHL